MTTRRNFLRTMAMTSAGVAMGGTSNLLNAKIGLEILEDYEIVELLHREFNKNTTTKSL